jgi:hypothetical protein
MAIPTYLRLIIPDFVCAADLRGWLASDYLARRRTAHCIPLPSCA